jgi:hypothetical protein
MLTTAATASTAASSRANDTRAANLSWTGALLLFWFFPTLIVVVMFAFFVSLGFLRIMFRARSNSASCLNSLSLQLLRLLFPRVPRLRIIHRNPMLLFISNLNHQYPFFLESLEHHRVMNECDE